MFLETVAPVSREGINIRAKLEGRKLTPAGKTDTVVTWERELAFFESGQRSHTLRVKNF